MAEVKQKSKYDFVTSYETPQGDVRIAHYAIAFGEPAGTVNINFIKRNGHFEGSRSIKPDDAIEFAKELIRRARLVKKAMRLWKKKRTEAPLVWTEEAMKLGYHRNI